MAQIKYIAPSPKAGTTEHTDNVAASLLVKAGFAEYVPQPNRNTPDPTNAWLRSIQEQDAMRKPSVHDTRADVVGVEWGVKVLGSGAANIIKRCGSETYFYDSAPADCPASIRQQFLDAAAVRPEANRAAIEAAKQEQVNREREDKSASRIQVMSALFGSKPL
jgi:hypothetical protein